MAKKYEQFPEQSGRWDAIYLSKDHIHKGREILNDCLYRCMTTGSAEFSVPPPALYIMAIATWDGSVTVLEHFMKKDWLPIPPRYFDGLKEEAERFGRPDFVEEDNIAFYESFQGKG